MTNSALIELQYLPPISYFSLFFKYNKVILEQWENYRKGSYRNRSYIAGSNGKLRLTIPLEKGKNQQMPIREVAIANNRPWRAQHWQSIRSAYGKAPFFEHYADYFRPFYEKKYKYLFDWNLELLYILLDLLDLERPYLSESYLVDTPPITEDLRGVINPKSPKGAPSVLPYPQLFQERTGFLPDLSIIDLLFCTGPQSSLIIESLAEGL